MKSLFVITLFLATAGCKTVVPAKPAARTGDKDRKVAKETTGPNVNSSTGKVPSEWSPLVKGVPYQLTLKNGLFGFCDDRGSWQFDIATGKQSSGVRHCDIDHEDVQSGCDDSIQIWGSPEGGNDHISVGDNNYLLNGHDRACDKEGQTVIAATLGAVEVIDGAANKVAIVDQGGGDRAVIGSGWVAWSTVDDKKPLRLETLAKAMEYAQTPK